MDDWCDEKAYEEFRIYLATSRTCLLMYYIDHCFDSIRNCNRGLIIREIQRTQPKLSLELMKLENLRMDIKLKKPRKMPKVPRRYGDTVLIYITNLPVQERMPALQTVLQALEEYTYQEVLFNLY